MNIFDFIKSQISILDVVQEYTSLKRAGVYWKGLCPFHSEKTGSFTVSPHRQIFYCFGCHASGDVIGFIAKIENFSQIEAAKFIAERGNLTIPDNVALEISQNSNTEKERYFKLCAVVAEWCQLNLSKNELAQRYLAERQITAASIKQFAIGYFPKGQPAIQSLIGFAQKQQILASDLIEAHIVQKNQQGIFFSGFEERIIFPIQDLMGRFCGFGGRVFQANDERVKYYNSHEHANFNKRNTLFGLNLAKKKVQEMKLIYLVEGYMDCIAMHQNGFSNTVATLGTACTNEHIELIARLTEQVYVLYDGDQAGLQAVERMVGLCWEANLEIKVVEFPDSEDPASYLTKYGPATLNKLIDHAHDIYHFMINQASRQFTNQNRLSQKFDASSKITELIQRVSDPLKRNILLQHAAQSLGVSPHSFKMPNTQDTARPEAEPEAERQQNLAEQVLLIFINHPEYFKPKYHYLTSYLGHPGSEILQKLLTLKDSQTEVKMADLMGKLNDEEQGFVRKCLLTYTDITTDEIDQILNRFHQKHWRQIVGHVKRLLSQETANQERMKQIIENFQILKSEILNGGQIDGS